MTDGVDERDVAVLRNKRDASRYQILVAIAARQPAVSQQEIADSVGVTAQAVSEYIRALVDAGHVEKHGRGRYEVTKEGVDWLISRTEDLREYTEFVSEDVIGQVESETAIAAAAVTAGDRVALSMRDGTLTASPEDADAGTGATAVALTDAERGADLGVAEFEGLLEYDPGTVTVVVLPGVREGGSRAVAADRLVDLAAAHDLVGVAGTEALAAVRGVDLAPDIRFGTPQAVQEAAVRGLSVLLVVTARERSAHTDRLREHNVSYELVDVRQ
ncbi:DUF7839 domain-containing protein [Halomarina ordinaria]|uniref:MarR family transcriptional regulator n=1 Tax=Halomarina ordinaria TaxID=3033939 RepID=A0ABD5UB72_9EURY|nr:MarR family transcriptional regulator [Halomarina sp. PSRA2]